MQAVEQGQTRETQDPGEGVPRHEGGTHRKKQNTGTRGQDRTRLKSQVRYGKSVWILTEDIGSSSLARAPESLGKKVSLVIKTG